MKLLPVTPWLQDPDLDLYVGDALETLRELPDESVDCVITSPPYWGLRDYGTGEWEGGDEGCGHVAPPKGGPHTASTLGPKRDGLGPDNAAWADSKRNHQYADVCGKCGARRVDRQLGLEPTPDEYVDRMVVVFREVRRVLAAHGTCWLNLGDSYIAAQGGRQSSIGEMPAAPLQIDADPRDRDDVDTGSWGKRDATAKLTPARGTTDLKPKDLAGIPWMVAFALRADGWYLRADIIWSKPNPMPESVTDRPTKAHEYVFLLSKGPRYWFDQEAVREPNDPRNVAHHDRYSGHEIAAPKSRAMVEAGFPMWQPTNGGVGYNPAGRNVRSVWEIATQPYPEAHFATYPEELVRRCLLAGCPEWVCGVCGKPRERLTSTEYENPGNRTTNGPRSVEARDDPRHGTVNSRGSRLEKRVTTEGWSDCGHHAYRPGVVLDPFFGSGTTGLVARKHGRRTVGIELNEKYAEQAARRLQQLSLFAS